MVKSRTVPSRRAVAAPAGRTVAVQLDIPTSVDLIGKHWTITRKVDDKNFGTCTHSTCVININPKHAVDHQRDTLLHEVIHALEMEGQLRMNERQVTGIATLLLAALRQNPALVKFILG